LGLFGLKADIKMIFKKFKNIFDVFQSEKHFKKQSLPRFQIYYMSMEG
jgi:hypothetical protein